MQTYMCMDMEHAKRPWEEPWPGKRQGSEPAGRRNNCFCILKFSSTDTCINASQSGVRRGCKSSTIRTDSRCSIPPLASAMQGGEETHADVYVHGHERREAAMGRAMA